MEKPRLTYENAPVGEEFVYQYKMTSELVADYVKSSGDSNPWYTGDSPFGGPIAPLVLPVRMHSHALSVKYDRTGNLHCSGDVEFFSPARVGVNITARARIENKYVKRDRQYIYAVCESTDENGRLICIDRRTFLLQYARAEEAKE